MSETHDTRALAIIPRTVTEVMQLAELLSKSELLPKALRGKVADVAMMIMAGTEMGFGPGASLRSIHVIEGRPVLSASAKVALVRSSGKCRYFECVEESEDRVIYETMRVDGTRPQRCTWTKQDIKNAGLNTKDNHRLHGRQMLHARCKSELCERVYEDVINGIATEEEVGDWTPPDRNGGDAEDAVIVSETPAVTLPPEFDAIEQTTTEAECKALVAKGGALHGQLAALTAAQKELANERYGAQLKKVREAEKQGAA